MPAVQGPALAGAVVCVAAAPDLPGLTTLMVRRSNKVGLAAGSWAFPGGRVDQGDHRPVPEDADPNPAAPMRRAAARELWEETSLVQVEAHLSRSALPPNPNAVLPWRPLWRWITPVGLPRRYDTWFFASIAEWSDEPSAHHSPEEIAEAAWLRPVEVLEAYADGALNLSFPTRRQLQILARCDDLEAFRRLVAGVRQPPPAQQPILAMTDEGVRVRLPDDRLWDVP